MENELSSHGRKGFLVDVPDPVYEPIGKNAFVARGIAAMNSGIVIVYRRDFLLRKSLVRRRVIIAREKRSYSAILQGEGTIIRCDSGQVTHNPDPHVHSQLTDFTDDIQPPTFPIGLPVELGYFVERIEEWRTEHLDYLPDSPGLAANARMP